MHFVWVFFLQCFKIWNFSHQNPFSDFFLTMEYQCWTPGAAWQKLSELSVRDILTQSEMPPRPLGLTWPASLICENCLAPIGRYLRMRPFKTLTPFKLQDLLQQKKPLKALTVLFSGHHKWKSWQLFFCGESSRAWEPQVLTGVDGCSC